jgi:hypothetical protein
MRGDGATLARLTTHDGIRFPMEEDWVRQAESMRLNSPHVVDFPFALHQERQQEDLVSLLTLFCITFIFLSKYFSRWTQT